MNTEQINELRKLAEAAMWTGRWYDGGCETLMGTYGDDSEGAEGHGEVVHPVPLGIVPFLAAVQPAAIIALIAEIDSLRDEVNGLTGSLDRAEKALKEAQQQPAVAWMIHEYQGTGEKRLQFQPHIPSIRDDVTGPIVTALYARPVPDAPAVAVPEMTDDALKEMLNAAQIVGYDDPLRIVRGFAMRVLQEWGNQEGMHKAFLDAVKPAVAVPAVPDQFCDVTKLIVPQEWRDVITELADDLSIELDMRYQSRSHYPSELRKYENEMQPVYRARALLQSTGDKK